MIKKTLFDSVPADEVKPIVYSMIDDFMTIISNDNMKNAIQQCFGELEVPEGKSYKEFFEEIDGNARICNFLKCVMDYAYEPLLRILSKIFCQPYEKYCKKSINQISKDLMYFAKSPFFGFFTSAIMSKRGS